MKKLSLFLFFITLCGIVISQQICKGYYPSYLKQDKVNISWDGSIDNNLSQGYGRAVYPNGTVYLGYMSNGIPNGKGSFYALNRSIFSGFFNYGRMNGQFLIIFSGNTNSKDIKYFYMNFDDDTFYSSSILQGYNVNNQKVRKFRYDGTNIRYVSELEEVGPALVGSISALFALGLTTLALQEYTTYELIMLIIIVK